MTAVALEPGFKMTELGSLPEDWEVAPMGYYVTLETGKRMKGGGLSQGDVISIGGEHIREDGRIFLDKPKYISEEFYRNLPGGRLELNDILMVKDGATTGKLAYMWELLTPKMAVNEHVFIIRSRRLDLLTNPFLYYFLFSNSGRSQIEKRYHGLIGGVNRSDMGSFLIPLPPLPEQRAIAHVLRTVQQAREATEAVIEAAKKVKRSLMRHLFTYGSVPVDKTDQVKLKDTEIGPVPEEWEACTLDDVKLTPKGSIVSGPFGSNIGRKFFVKSGVPLIRGCNLTKGERLFVEEGFVFITEEKAQELANCTALPGDLVFTAAGTIGQIGLIPDNCRYPKYVISNKQLRARVDTSRVSPLYLFFWFSDKRVQDLLHMKQRGTSIPVINLSILRSIPIAFPSLPEQRKIASILSTVDRKIETEQARKAALDNLFKSLLANLMTGKIRVKVGKKIK